MNCLPQFHNLAFAAAFTVVVHQLFADKLRLQLKLRMQLSAKCDVGAAQPHQISKKRQP